jgi:hypothetical protein
MMKWFNPDYRAIRARYMARYREWEHLRRTAPERASAELRDRLRAFGAPGDRATPVHSLLHLLDLSAMRGDPWQRVEPDVLEALAQGEL